jgi:lysozyme
MTSAYDPDALKASLTRHEARKNTVYKDSKGLLTVGIGHNISIAQTDYVIDAIYGCDIVGCEKSLDQHVPWWRDLDPVRQAAMMELMFNMGWGDGSNALSSFKNTLAAWKAGNYASAASGLLSSKWANDVKKDRANDIAGMVRTGEWPSWLAQS